MFVRIDVCGFIGNFSRRRRRILSDKIGLDKHVFVWYYTIMSGYILHSDQLQETHKKMGVTLRLPGEIVIVGPGTVQTSHISTATISEMVKGFKQTSELGIYGEEENSNQ